MAPKILFYITIGIVVVAIAGGVVYFFFQKPKKIEVVEQTLPKPEVLIANKVTAPVLSFSGENVWYFDADNRLLRTPTLSPPYQGGDPPAGEAGEEAVAVYPLPEPLSNVTKVVWQKDGSDFIVEQNLDGHTRYWFYNSDTRAFTKYPEQMREPKFLEPQEQIVYDWVGSEGTHEIDTANLEGRDYVKVADLYPDNYRIEANRQGTEIALFSDNPEQMLTLSILDLRNGSFTNVGNPARYSGAKFSPDGTKLLMAKFENVDEPPHLYWYDLKTGATEEMGFAAEIWQTAWSADSKSLYIGTSGGLSKFDFTDFGKTIVSIFDTADDLIPRDLFLSADESEIFFVNEKTGYLYRLKLK